MKVVGLDGRTHNWNLVGHVPLGSEESGSQYHSRCRVLLARLFPAERILEEVLLPGSRGLRCDFCLPGRGLLIEVHGRQHYEFVLHFHQTPLGFVQAQQRDRNKQLWCEINRFRYIELPYDESDEDWTRRIVHGDN